MHRLSQTAAAATAWWGRWTRTADRDAGAPRVAAVHECLPFTKTMTAAGTREVRDLARWLGREPPLP